MVSVKVKAIFMISPMEDELYRRGQYDVGSFVIINMKVLSSSQCDGGKAIFVVELMKVKLVAIVSATDVQLIIVVIVMRIKSLPHKSDGGSIIVVSAMKVLTSSSARCRQGRHRQRNQR